MKYIECRYIGETKKIGRFGLIETNSIQKLTKAEWIYVDTHSKNFKRVSTLEKEVEKILVEKEILPDTTKAKGVKAKETKDKPLLAKSAEKPLPKVETISNLNPKTRVRVSK
jgi:uncharacterized membrane-anchored protein